MIHLAYLSLTVSAALRGNMAGMIGLFIVSIILPVVIARKVG
jgi:hypothetical protein